MQLTARKSVIGEWTETAQRWGWSTDGDTNEDCLHYGYMILCALIEYIDGCAQIFIHYLSTKSILCTMWSHTLCIVTLRLWTYILSPDWVAQRLASRFISTEIDSMVCLINSAEGAFIRLLIRLLGVRVARLINTIKRHCFDLMRYYKIFNNVTWLNCADYFTVHQLSICLGLHAVATKDSSVARLLKLRHVDLG